MAFCACLLAAAPVAGAATELKVSGCDLLGLEFSKACYRIAAEKGFRVVLTLDGSRPGLVAVQAGRADLALLMLPDEERAQLEGLETIPLGYLVAMVLVPVECPLNQITLEQVERVFAAARDFSPASPRWSELGVTGAWAGSPVVSLVPAVGRGIMADYFRRVALQGREFKPSVQRYADQPSLRRMLAGDTRALVLGSASAAEIDGLKVIPVVRGSGPGVPPTAENLHRGTYPFRLPLTVAFRPQRRADVQPLVEFFLSDAGASELARADLVSLPAAERRELLRMLKK